jgi:hypothetical protein
MIMLRENTRIAKVVFNTCFLLIIIAAMTACNSANEESPLSLLNQDGKHAAGWVEAHGPHAVTDITKCETCHGNLSDPSFPGGTSNISCFDVSFNGQSCHGSGESLHPVSWIEDHGTLAKPDGATCTPCHGDDLDGGIVSNVSCFSDSNNGQACHVFGPAFHPVGWLNKSSRGTSGWHADAYQSGLLINGVPCETCHSPPVLDAWPDGKCVQCHFDIDGAKSPDSLWTHSKDDHHQFLDSAEADVCANCHEVNDRFGHEPSFTGCFDCHGIHPQDWSDPGVHGNAAKSQPLVGSDTGFANCRVCHGDDFSGALARSCAGSGCHETFNINDAIPHPEGSRWEEESAPTHRTTDEDNAVVCVVCHSEIQTPSVGCQSNNQCHDDD